MIFRFEAFFCMHFTQNFTKGTCKSHKTVIKDLFKNFDFCFGIDPLGTLQMAQIYARSGAVKAFFAKKSFFAFVFL